MATTTSNRVRSSSASAALRNIKLSNRDINVVSAIAQKTSLPRDVLISYAVKSHASPAALKVIHVLLDLARGTPVGSTASDRRAADVAKDFKNWVVKLKKAG